MKKSYIVDSTCNDMRLDRWLRLKIGKIPQGLVEKYLRTGKIKLNRKKVKSSFKVKTKDEINIFNIEFKETIQQSLLNTPEVSEICEITGRFDIIIKVLAEDLEQLHTIIIDKIGKIDGIQNTETFVELQKTDKAPIYLSKK